LSAGSSPDFGASNSGTCRSFSTRSLFSTIGAGASMRGFTRVATRFSSTRAASTRAFLASTPTATSRATLRRARSQAMPPQMPAPMRSTMVSHDTPNASEMPAIQAASMNKVAPRKFMPDSRPLPMCPTTPPALAGNAPASQCSVASPQLAISIRVKPAIRTAVLKRVRPSSWSA
jgi:hypothetical protein